MSHQVATAFPPGDVVFLDRGNGTSVLVHLHGATILSWRCQGQEVLFVSEKAVFNNKKAIRGGIPVVFPNFGPWDCGPQHGFGRIKRWTTEISPRKDKSGNVIAAFTLEEDDETKAMWDYKFRVIYTLELLDKSLIMNMSVHNTDSKDYDFTCLLHTYFRTPDVTQSAIVGLQGLQYADKVDGGERKEDREEIHVAENYDRIYKESPSEISVSKVADGRLRVIMQTFDFPDIVVWNPWSEKAASMADFGDSEYTSMLCVEAGCVSTPVQLQAGHQFECSQKFTVMPMSQ